MKNFRKFLAVFLSIAMVMCSALPNLASENNDATSETSESTKSKIEEQLKNDLGEERANEILNGESEEEEETSRGEACEPDVGASTASPEEETDEDVGASTASPKEETNEDIGASTASPEEETETTDPVETSEEGSHSSPVQGESESAEEETEPTVGDEPTEESSRGEVYEPEVTEPEEVKATESEIKTKDELLGEPPVWMYYWTHEDMYGVITLHLSGNRPTEEPFHGEINTTGKIEYDDDDVEGKRWRFSKIIIHDPIYPVSCYNMFKDFSKVEKIEGLGYLDTISVTNFTSMFEGCSSLKALDLSDLDTSSAVTMPYMFKGCSNLRTILVDNSFVRPSMPEFSFSMFNNCPKLHGQRGTESKEGEEYNVDYARVDGGPTNPGFFTKKGEEWMYWYHEGPYILHLTSNKPRSGDFEIVTRYDVVEYGLYNELNKGNIKSVVFDNEWVAETYAELFNGFTNLEEIEGLDKLKIDKVKSMRAMFKDCKKLTDIDLSYIQNADIENISEMFYGCSSLKKIMADEDFAVVCGNTSSSENMFKDCTNLVGCNGTTYDSSHIDKEYARLDCIPNPNNKGYFSTPPWMYWWLTDSGKTMHLSGTKPTGTTAKEITVTSAIEYVGLQKANVTKVVFDDTVLAQSGEEFFANFTNLVTIEGLDKLNTILVESMKGMFKSCEKLKMLDLRTFKTQIVKEMAEMFENCTALHTIFVNKDDFIVSNVKLSSGDKGTNMFKGCISLYGQCGTKVDKMTDVNYAHIDDTSDPGYFTYGPWLYYYVEGNNTIHYTNTNNDNCDSITRIDKIVYYNFEKKNITKAVFDTDIDAVTYAGLFEEFTALKDIDGFDKLKFNQADSMKRMFYACSSLEILDLRSFNTSAVKYMAEMFTNCSSLTMIIATNNFVTTAVTDYGNNMFKGCSKLVGGNGTEYKDSYNHGSGWARLDGGPGSSSGGYFSTYPWMWWYLTDGGKVIHYTNSYSTISGIRGVSADVAIYYSGMTSDEKSKIIRAVFDNDITAKTCQKFFNYFYGLKYVQNIEKLNTSDVEDMSHMFYDCGSLAELDLTGLNTSKVKYMNHMFANCASLKSIDLSTFNTANVTNMWAMFSGCDTLALLDLRSFNTEKVTNMNLMYFSCDNLETIIAGNDFKVDLVTADYQMFHDCGKLIGCNGTRYDSSRVDKKYARIDGEPNDTDLGYFSTDAWMYWYLDNNGKTIHYTNSDADGRVGVTRFDQLAYFGLSKEDKAKITKAVFDDNIDAETCVSFFMDFSGLVSIEDLDKLDTTALTDMQEMFSGCSSLKNLDVSNLNTDDVENMILMFYRCSSLEGLDLSEWDTSKVKSMEAMFRECSSLKFINLVNFDTAAADGMSNMFYGCSSLQSLDLANLATDNVKNMSGMFANCTKLESIFVTDLFNIAAVTDGSNMFNNCPALKGSSGTAYDASHVGLDYAHVDEGSTNPGYFSTNDWMWWKLEGTELHLYGKAPDSYDGVISGSGAITYDPAAYVAQKVIFENEVKARTCNSMFAAFHSLGEIEALDKLDTSSVMSMNMMFYECFALPKIDLSRFNTSKVTDMKQMFYGCFKIDDLDMTGFDTSNVTNMYDMFSNCRELETLDLTKFNTKNVKSMSYLFVSCYNLEELDLSSFDTSNVETMVQMFKNCTKLKTIIVSNKFVTSQVTNSSEMFTDSTQLTGSAGTTYDSSHVDKEYARIDEIGKPGYFSRGYWMWWYLDDSGKVLHLTNSDPKNGKAKGINSGDEVVYEGLDKTKVTKAVFDDYIVADTCEGFFSDFTNMTEIEKLNQLELEFANSMDEMFMNCKKLKSIDMSNFYTSNMTNMSETFAGCESLTGLDFLSAGEFNTSNVEGMLAMFKGSKKITSLDLSIFDTAKVHWFSEMFANCSSLKTITVSNKFIVDTAILADGAEKMFEGCTALVGGRGTTYSSSHINHEYARIDLGPNSLAPGYFTNANGGSDIIDFILVKTEPTTTKYSVGQTLDPSGLSLTLHYSDGTVLDVAYTLANAKDFAFNPGLNTKLTVNHKLVIVTYGAHSATFAITVEKTGGGGGSHDSGSSSGSGGSGGSSGGPVIIAENAAKVTYVNFSSTPKDILSSINSRWALLPSESAWQLNTIDSVGTVTNAVNGFYVYTLVKTHIINNVPLVTQTNSTYCFDEKGYMMTGWVRTSDGKWFFFENEKNDDQGKMTIGWKQIQGSWYCFGPDGAMYINTTTPDGYRVGTDGRWLG